MRADNTAITDVIHGQHPALVNDWMAELAARGEARLGSAPGEATELLAAVEAALRNDADATAFETAAWQPVRALLESVSRSRAAQGASAGSTSLFVLSMKKPLFDRLLAALGSQPQALVSALWAVTSAVDRMAQWTVNTYQKSRDDIIMRQQHELLELSTPVIKLWEGVLAVPMIGTLDSARSQLVMEALLQRIVETGSELAIVDITGVPTVDTLVAQHLLKTVTAIRLMGAECIISGIRPQIAQTIVHLGIDLTGVTTKASLADALAVALKRTGHVVSRARA